MRKDAPRSIISKAGSDEIEVSVRIGRAGVSESLISELSDQLSRKNLVKVKANKGISESSERTRIFNEIAISSKSKLVFQRGNVAVFWSGK